MAVHATLNGTFQSYPDFEQRPVHPVTGRKADYFYEEPGGKRVPRWRDPFPKSEDPAKCWYSVTEVAKLLGRHRNTVLLALRTGAMKGHRPALGDGHKGIWMISGQAVVDFVAGQTAIAPLPERVEEAQTPKQGETT